MRRGREKWRRREGKGEKMKAEGEGTGAEAIEARDWLGWTRGAPTLQVWKVVAERGQAWGHDATGGRASGYLRLPPCTPGTGFQDLDFVEPHCRILGPRPRGVWSACPHSGLPLDLWA